MPRISEFYGIVIYLYHADHPPPHFHAIYGEREAVVAIEDLEVLAGRLPPRAMRLVRTWAGRHRAELAANWERARDGLPVRPVEPLE